MCVRGWGGALLTRHKPEVKEEGLKKHLCTDNAVAVDREETRHF